MQLLKIEADFHDNGTCSYGIYSEEDELVRDHVSSVTNWKELFTLLGKDSDIDRKMDLLS